MPWFTALHDIPERTPQTKVADQMSGADGRVAKTSIVPMCDNGVVTENRTPAPAVTGRGHGQLMEGVDMSDVSERRLIALDYLTRVADDLRRVATLRVNYIRNARTYGATNQDIATALGITESAVRALVKRHDGTA